MVPEDDIGETPETLPIRSLARKPIPSVYVTSVEADLFAELIRRFRAAGFQLKHDEIVTFDINSHGVTAVRQFGEMDTLPWNEE